MEEFLKCRHHLRLYPGHWVLRERADDRLARTSHVQSLVCVVGVVVSAPRWFIANIAGRGRRRLYPVWATVLARKGGKQLLFITSSVFTSESLNGVAREEKELLYQRREGEIFFLKKMSNYFSTERRRNEKKKNKHKNNKKREREEKEKASKKKDRYPLPTAGSTGEVCCYTGIKPANILVWMPVLKQFDYMDKMLKNEIKHIFGCGVTHSFFKSHHSMEWAISVGENHRYAAGVKMTSAVWS